MQLLEYKNDSSKDSVKRRWSALISYEYIKRYQNNNSLMKSSFSFTQNIFSFDLSIWRDKGFYQDNYIPNSLVFENEIIANISVSIMQLQISGVPTKAVQLGSVGVLPKV